MRGKAPAAIRVDVQESLGGRDNNRLFMIQKLKKDNDLDENSDTASEEDDSKQFLDIDLADEIDCPLVFETKLEKYNRRV